GGGGGPGRRRGQAGGPPAAGGGVSWRSDTCRGARSGTIVRAGSDLFHLRAFRSRTARRRAFRLQPAATTAGPVSPRNRRSRQRRVRARRFPSGLNRDFRNAQTRWGSLAFSSRRLRKRDAWKLPAVPNRSRDRLGKRSRAIRISLQVNQSLGLTFFFWGIPLRPRAAHLAASAAMTAILAITAGAARSRHAITRPRSPPRRRPTKLSGGALFDAF